MAQSVSAAGPQDMSGYQGRYKWLIVIVALAFMVIIGRLWHLQVLHGERFYRASTENIVQAVDIKPARGRIFDTHGVVLADNRPSFDVYLVPAIFLERRKDRRVDKARVAQKLEQLRSFLNLTPAEVVALEKKLERKLAEIVVRRDVSRAQVASLESYQLELAGVEVRPTAHRHYPLHMLGAHTVGFLGELSDKDLQAWEGFGYQAGDYVGRMGLERAFEDILRGSPGLERRVVDARGTPQGESETSLLIGEYQQVRTISGKDLVVTLDTELMLIIDQAMRKHAAGAVVALDPRDGSVLALYSKPSFDPNSWTGRLSAQEKLRSDNDPYKPMLDKSVNAYFPGSVYKIVGSLAALEEKTMALEEEVKCSGAYRFGGRSFRCWKSAGHGHVDVIKSLASSCDVYYYRVAELMGIDKLAEYAYRFGFGEPTGLPINHESPGRVPTKEWHRKHGPDGYQYGFALNTVIGQGDTLASPLQVAVAYAAIANGGDLFYPRLIKSVRTQEGRAIFDFEPQRRKRIEFDPQHLSAIRQGLWEVVNTENGTAYKARPKHVETAGKTGTAQVHKIGKVRVANRDKEFRFRDHAWYAAYAPVDNPQLVLVVFLQHGGHGGTVAAPVAAEIFDHYFTRDLSKPLTARVSEQAAKLKRLREQAPSTPEEVPGADEILPGQPLPDSSPDGHTHELPWPSPQGLDQGAPGVLATPAQEARDAD